jgi:hypothetical protein
MGPCLGRMRRISDGSVIDHSTICPSSPGATGKHDAPRVNGMTNDAPGQPK